MVGCSCCALSMSGWWIGGSSRLLYATSQPNVVMAGERECSPIPLVRQPPPGLGGGEQLRERRVDGGRLFAVDRMARARDHEQAGGRHRALEEHAAVETRLVLVADNDEERGDKFFQRRL